ncbi:MAG TPA: fibronectin type III domain-containing protein [Phycisphaerales bacterium]|nr:fibronectin type III domain-containing protein [Phycisphaerales bacterium]
MRIVRSPRNKFYGFAKDHVGPFTTAPAAVGLSPTQAAAYTQAVTDAGDALDSISMLKQALKTATANANEKFRTLNQVMTQTVELIDIFAANSADPQEVYNTAELLPPTVPSEAGPPGLPGLFRATLNEDGSVKISWKCKNPVGTQGTVYVVRRKLLNATQFTQVALTGSRSYTDNSIPSASGGAVYTVQAQRGNVLGPTSAPFTLQFGIDGGGNFAITGMTEGVNGKMAA